MFPNEILSNKIKLQVDLPSPPRVVREKLAGAGCRGPSLSTKGPHTDACPLWDPPLSTKGFILSFKGTIYWCLSCPLCPGLDPGSKKMEGWTEKNLKNQEINFEVKGFHWGLAVFLILFWFYFGWKSNFWSRFFFDNLIFFWTFQNLIPKSK